MGSEKIINMLHLESSCRPRATSERTCSASPLPCLSRDGACWGLQEEVPPGEGWENGYPEYSLLSSV